MIDAVNRSASKDHKIFKYVESCEIFSRSFEREFKIIPDRINDLQKSSSPLNASLYDVRTFQDEETSSLHNRDNCDVYSVVKGKWLINSDLSVKHNP
jgi:hypothetical protein